MDPVIKSKKLYQSNQALTAGGSVKPPTGNQRASAFLSNHRTVCRILPALFCYGLLILGCLAFSNTEAVALAAPVRLRYASFDLFVLFIVMVGGPLAAAYCFEEARRESSARHRAWLEWEAARQNAERAAQLQTIIDVLNEDARWRAQEYARAIAQFEAEDLAEQNLHDRECRALRDHGGDY